MTLVTRENYEYVLRYFEHQPQIIVDTETTGLRPYHGDHIVGIVLAADNQTFYLPYRHRGGGSLPMHLLYPVLRLLEDPYKTLIFHHAKFDLHMLAQEGMKVPRYAEDTMLAAHLMNENEPSLKLKDLGAKFINPAAGEEEERLKVLVKDHGGRTNKDWKADIGLLPASLAEPYACMDGTLTEALHRFYMPHLQTWELYRLFKEVCRYNMVTFRMERRGIRVDPDLIEQYIAEAAPKAAELRKQIQDMAGYEINPASYKQLCTWLGIHSSKREVLQLLEDTSAGARAVLQWRGYSKVIGTYYAPYLYHMDKDHLIHASIKIHGAATGRSSCEDPNLQQVAQFTEVFKVRNVFIPRDGFEFLNADYSQAEYRVAAHYAQQMDMIESFMNGVDFHAATAARLGVSRKIAKTLNFGILYGMGAKSLGESLGVPKAEAQAYLTLYRQTYPNLEKLMRAMEERARGHAVHDKQYGYGYIRLFTGRVRHFNLPVLNEYTHKIEPEFRKAGNSLIQGTVAEQLRIALTRLDDEIAEPLGLHQIVPVHDSDLIEVPLGTMDHAAPQVRTILEETAFRPPLLVDLHRGFNWGEGLVSYDPPRLVQAGVA